MMTIKTRVDGEWRVVDWDLYLDFHAAAAARRRAEGLTGHQLDVAIVADVEKSLSAWLARDGEVLN